MQLPSRIGKYELEEFLGGGMSHVYRARDTVLGRMVAVKILTESGCADADTKARFLQEARMAAGISHENIIQIHDYGEDQGRPFIVMEFLVGEDLRNAIRNGHTGDITGKLNIALQVARALEHVHSNKIIHRDIKPENIHLDAAGKAKLMDFGIAKAEGLSMTKTGFSVGTPYYMPPEQVLGQAVNEQADVYSFGILLYELLSGVKPFTGDTVERLFYAVLNEQVNLEPLRMAGVPDPVCRLVARCTQKKAADRPPDFRTLSAELEPMIGGAPLSEATQTAILASAPLPPAGGRSRPMARWMAAALALLAAVGTTFFLLSRRDKPRPSEPQPPSALSTPTGEMTLVPAGAFLAGEEKESLSLAAFYIDKLEVTNREYEKFCRQSGHPLPRAFPADQLGLPVVNVTIGDARAFAKWAGKRLPASLEWEKAARGSEGRIYPWGNEADAWRAVVSDNPSLPEKALVVAGSLAAGASPCGALDMAGNVWELVDERKTPSVLSIQSFASLLKPAPTVEEPWHVIKGGSFDRPLSEAEAFEWITIPARFTAANIGFRCVRDP